jgi:hypothetical protein
MVVPTSQDKRRHPRKECDAAVEIEDLGSGKLMPGRLYNFSLGGVHFELDEPLPPGTEVRVSLLQPAAGISFRGCRGIVRWSCEIQDPVVLNTHGAGAEFTEPPWSRTRTAGFKVIPGGATWRAGP